MHYIGWGNLIVAPFGIRNHMKLFRLILSILRWSVLATLTVLAVYAISSNFSVLGGYRTYLVQSGSMEPSIMTGDVIVIQNKGTYFMNDVITFRESADRIVTHRIISVEKDSAGNKYSTKGDANRSGDENVISNSQILGKVFLVIPKFGYLIAFIKSQQGFIFLIIIPAIVFILDELVKVKKNAKQRD